MTERSFTRVARSRGARSLCLVAALATFAACSAYDRMLLGSSDQTQQGTARSGPDAGAGDAGVAEDAALASEAGTAEPVLDAAVEDAAVEDAAIAQDGNLGDAATEAPAIGSAPDAGGGAADPDPPECLEHSECDRGEHCEDGACVVDRPSGERCTSDAECASEHCDAMRCCEVGEDCCSNASDCPAEYSAPASCVDANRCQGSRVEASCGGGICGSVAVDDDSACDGSVRARECGTFGAVYCGGESDQADAPECPSDCSDDSDCASGAHCRDSACVSDLPDGSRCQRDADCDSEYCNNGFCCDEGRCCAADDDCEDRFVCLNARTCSGVVFRASCNAEATCEEESEPRANSLGCFGQLARICLDGDVVRCPLSAFPFVPTCGAASCVGDDCSSGSWCTGDDCWQRW